MTRWTSRTSADASTYTGVPRASSPGVAATRSTPSLRRQRADHSNTPDEVSAHLLAATTSPTTVDFRSARISHRSHRYPEPPRPKLRLEIAPSLPTPAPCAPVGSART